jgi:hypothetical protein
MCGCDQGGFRRGRGVASLQVLSVMLLHVRDSKTGWRANKDFDFLGWQEVHALRVLSMFRWGLGLTPESGPVRRYSHTGVDVRACGARGGRDARFVVRRAFYAIIVKPFSAPRGCLACPCAL